MYNKFNLKIVNCAEEKRSNRSDVLKGVYFEEKGTTATNGKILIHVTTPNLNDADLPSTPSGAPVVMDKVILAADVVQGVLKNIPKNTPLPILQHAWPVKCTPEAVTLVTSDLATERPISARPVEGKYPDYAQVIPKPSKDARSILLDPDLLQTIVSNFQGFTESMRITVESDPLRAVLIEGKNLYTGQKMTAVIMPKKS